MSTKHWLLKAEPDTRIVKGKDVKFSVDDFESVGTSPWEGVRNYEARNLMKEMKVGEKALFYHSNCKTPGIAAFAEVSKEAYPDHTAWDTSHPYYDQKTDQTSPKWFMVDLTFKSRAEHFVPLALLKYIADLRTTSSTDGEDSGIPAEIAYLGVDGVQALKAMDLVTRGRLSVQRVNDKAWDAIQLLATTGGWDELDLTGALKKRKTKKVRAARTPIPRMVKPTYVAKITETEASGPDDVDGEYEHYDVSSKGKRKPKNPNAEEGGSSKRRRNK